MLQSAIEVPPVWSGLQEVPATVKEPILTFWNENTLWAIYKKQAQKAISGYSVSLDVIFSCVFVCS